MKANAQFPDEQSDGGEFQRQEDAFHAWVKDEASSPHRWQGTHYQMYVTLACLPHAHHAQG